MKTSTYSDNALLTQISDCLQRIGRLDFDAPTIRSLYTLLRQQAPPKSITRDIADFFAHPERDKGPIHGSARKLVTDLTTAYVTKTTSFTVSPIPHSQIITDLNSVIDAVGLVPIAETLSAHVSLILLTSLQGSTLKIGSQRMPVALYVLDASEIALAFSAQLNDMTFVFPLITMPNPFGMPQFMPDTRHAGWSHLGISFKGGKLDHHQTHAPLIIDMRPAKQNAKKKADKPRNKK
ncbi:MAG: hypothetical protein AB7T20_11190 [Steroidobacteraceae bacterium]